MLSSIFGYVLIPTHLHEVPCLGHFGHGLAFLAECKACWRSNLGIRTRRVQQRAAAVTEQNMKYFSKEAYIHRFPAKFNTNEGSNPVCFGALGKILSNDVCLFYFASVSVIFLGSLQSAIAFKLGTNPNPHRVYQIQFKVED